MKREDKIVLERQLGREPRNVVKILKRCEAGYPQVIVTGPILDKKNKVGIFPTTLWLTCPELNYRIGQLESKGLVKEIQSRIKKNSKLTQRLKQAHKDYAKYRLSLVKSDRLSRLEQENPGQYHVLKNSGVGGILEFDGIKCLHTHYAHYLYDNINPVGKIVDELLNKEYGELDSRKCIDKCKGDNDEDRSS